MSDLISRQSAIDAVLKSDPNCGIDCSEVLRMLPSVETKGKWLADNNFYYETRFKCSVCGESEHVPTIGFTKYIPLWNFCPNCGADMR